MGDNTPATIQDLISSLRSQLDEAMVDAQKIDNKNNKSARTRLRKTLQGLIAEAKETRKAILEGGKTEG